MNGKKIHVTSTSDIHSSGISVRALVELDHLHQVAMIRRSGSSLLDMCYVAKGALDGFIEWNLSVWDFAATTLLIKEAGGVVTDSLGNPPLLEPGKKYTIVASNGFLHQELLGWISTAKK
jgi:myo-inositol-1(or 4)-monophosphatase